MRETKRTEQGDLPLPELQQGGGEVRQLTALPGWPRRTAIRLQIRAAALGDWLNDCGQSERDSGSLFNLSPVIIALGILAYFMAPSEPVVWLPPLSASVLLVVAMRVEGDGPGRLALMAAVLFFAGMTAAQVRTGLNAGAVIGGQIRAEVSGTVLDVDRNSRGKPRYTIRPDRIGDLTLEELPPKIRLSASSPHEAMSPGQRIEGLAQLQGFSGPAMPGGYDFGFFNWYEGLGGTGFFLGAPKSAPVAAEQATVTRQRLSNWLARTRIAITNRIRAGLPGEPGDIAVALITGDRTGIDQETSESLRKSGLAHILAISGLHMALVTLTVIGALRFVFALSPELALRYPVRKWAAAAGFAAATIYLLLSGAGIATQRAWIMIAVMLAATMLDRRALTMRNVSIAALIILVLAPQSLLLPGFQMSFAAVAALVAAYEGWNGWRRRRSSRKESASVAGKLWLQLPAWAGSIAFTSLVAGLATALFAAWHFHRIAPLGLFANLGAMPIVSIAVMPLALVAVLLMPYGFEQIALGLLGKSIEWVLVISGKVASLDAGGSVGAVNWEVFASGVAGLVLLTALRSSLRYAGLVAIAAMPVLWQPPVPPELIVTQDGRAIGLANEEGNFALLYPRRNRFVSNIWQRAWPGGAGADEHSNSGECGRDHCVANLASGHRVEIVYDPDLLDQACLTADILIAPRLHWVDCRRGQEVALILKRGNFERNGTHVIRVAGELPEQPFLVETAYRSDNRPWNRVRLEAVAASERRWLQRIRKRQQEDADHTKPE